MQHRSVRFGRVHCRVRCRRRRVRRRRRRWRRPEGGRLNGGGNGAIGQARPHGRAHGHHRRRWPPPRRPRQPPRAAAARRRLHDQLRHQGPVHRPACRTRRAGRRARALHNQDDTIGHQITGKLGSPRDGSVAAHRPRRSRGRPRRRVTGTYDIVDEQRPYAAGRDPDGQLMTVRSRVRLPMVRASWRRRGRWASGVRQRRAQGTVGDRDQSSFPKDVCCPAPTSASSRSGEDIGDSTGQPGGQRVHRRGGSVLAAQRTSASKRHCRSASCRTTPGPRTPSSGN